MKQNYRITYLDCYLNNRVFYMTASSRGAACEEALDCIDCAGVISVEVA